MPNRIKFRVSFDAPWKVVLKHLRDVLEIAFPELHKLIDYSVEPKFLDKELEALGLEKLGSKTVDKLIEVTLKSGKQKTLFIHIEVQAQKQDEFGERMHNYYCFIRAHYPNRDVISLAILTDNNPNWMPNSHTFELAGCKHEFTFPVFKIILCKDPEKIYEQTGNLFALVVAATQLALKTGENPEKRSDQRLKLLAYLYRKGIPRAVAIDFYRALWWLTRFPKKEMELNFQRKMSNFALQHKPMEHLLAPFEIEAMNKGLVKGRQEGRQEGRQVGRKEGLQEGVEKGRQEALRAAVLSALEVRFGNVPATARKKITALSDKDDLKTAHRLAITSPDLKKFLQTL